MRTRIAALSCFLVIFLTPRFAAAQESAPGTSAKSAFAQADTSKEAIVYEQVRGHLKYEEDGSGSNDTYARIRVQSYAGVQRMGQLVFNYDSANSQFEVRSVRVTKPDGKVVSAGPDVIQDMTSPIAQLAPTYTDLRQEHVVVPDLSPGDILEYETLTTYRPLVPGQVWQVWNFINEDICLDEIVDLDVASKLSIHTTTSGADPPEMAQHGDRTVWTWKTDHRTRESLPFQLPATLTPFPDARSFFRGPSKAPARHIWITTFASWAELSAWYAGLEHDRRIPDSVVRAKAEELSRNAHSGLEKTRAIYDYVARNIRYVSLSFGVGRFQPHAAAEVLAHQYGDCKDKATLFEAMLEAVGIHASPALLLASGNMEDVPSPLVFDHVISYVVLDGKELWLDSTLGVAPFGYLWPNIRGKRALVASRELGSELRQIPSALATPTLYRFSLDGTFGGNRNLDATLTFETRGDWEMLLRLGLLQASPAQFQSMLEAAAKKSGKTEDVTFSSLDASDPYDTSSPLRLSLRMTAAFPEEKEKDSKLGNEKSTASEPPLTSKNVEELVSFLLPALLPDKPVSLGDPKELAIHLKLTFDPVSADKVAKKLKVAKTTPAHLTQDFAEYEQSWSWEAPVLSGDWRVATKGTSFSMERNLEYSAFRSAVEAELREIAYALGAPRSEEVSGELAVRYFEAVKQIYARKFDTAQQLLESVVEDDPKYVDAWKSLAQVRAGRKLWDASRQAYQKLIDLSAGDTTAYNGLVRGYMAERMYPEAIAAAKKELEKFPQLPDGQANLGWAHLEAGQFEESAEAYQAAANLLPRNPRIQIELGRAYSGAGDMKKAQMAFRRAAVLDSSPLTLNDAAYFSAEAGLDLKTAEEESSRAVTAVEKQLNAVKLEQVSLGTGQLLARVAAYWDTLGWIKFKRGDLPGAEKYLRAATDLTDEATIQMHMGRVQEALGHKEAAMRFYVKALDATQVTYYKTGEDGKTVPLPPRPLTSDETAARDHLAALAGSPEAVKEQMQEGSYNRNWKRTVAVPNKESLEQTERFVTLVAPGPKIASSAIWPGLKDQPKLLVRFGDKAPPQTFPDNAVTSIPRIAVIHCRNNPTQCEFEFLPIDGAEPFFTDSNHNE